MNLTERALYQERVRTLVMRHALEAALARLGSTAGADAEAELLRLEHAVVAASRALPVTLKDGRLATMVAVEDALVHIRGAFDAAHGRLDAPTPTPTGASALAA